MPTYFIDIDPQPYVRRTRQGRFSPAAKKYHKWLNDFRWLCKEQGLETLPDAGTRLNFYIAMPRSWPKGQRRAMLGKGHHTPKGKSKDLDNLMKAVNDALRPSDDGNIYHQSGCKMWAETGGIEIIIRERWEP